MELTLDQALKKGVEAHKAGQIKEADHYYTAILKAQPKHPEQPAVWKDAGDKRHKPQTYSCKQKLIGIAMMHKSNLVPVFSTKDAKEISKMRRG